MNELMVVGFKGTHRARQVLDELMELKTAWAIELDLEDAVAVYRSRSGRLRMDTSVRPTVRQGATLGSVLGGLMGAILMTPFTGGASMAVAAAQAGAGAIALGATGAVIGSENAAQKKQESGLTEDFVRQVAGMVQPGQSALFIFAEAPHPEAIAARFRGYGGTILRTTVPPAEARRLQHILSSSPLVSESRA